MHLPLQALAPILEYIGRSVAVDQPTLDIAWPGDYEAVVLEYRNCRPRSASQRWNALQVSNDGGQTFLAGTSYHYRGVVWGTAQGTNFTNGAPIIARPTTLQGGAGQDNAANESGNWTVVIARPFDTSQRTRLFYHGHHRAIGVPHSGIGGGMRTAADRTDAVRMEYHDAGGSQIDNMDGEVRAYGLRRFPGQRLLDPLSAGPDGLGLPILEPITQKVASDQATLDFSWAKSYDAVFALVDNAAPVTGDNSFGMQTSSDGGATFDSGVHYVSIGAIIAGGLAALSATAFMHLTAGNQIGNNGPIAAANADSGWDALVTIHQPSDPTLKTMVTSNGAYFNAASTFVPTVSWGYRDAAEIVNGIRFQIRNGAFGNISRGRFTLWGLLAR